MKSEFQVHMLNDEGLRRANALAEAFSAFLERVEEMVPPGRDRAIIVTKLQEACFFAKRGIASMPECQVEVV